MDSLSNDEHLVEEYYRVADLDEPVMIDVRVTRHPLDLAVAYTKATDPAAGGISIFSGTTRNHHMGRAVTLLEYEAHARMACKEMLRICREAASGAFLRDAHHQHKAKPCLSCTGNPAPSPHDDGSLAPGSGVGSSTVGDASNEAPAPVGTSGPTYLSANTSSSTPALHSLGRSLPVRRLVAWHRIGPVPIGECSVLIVAAADHRDQSFPACRYVIDEIKARVPIWKRETYAQALSAPPAAGTAAGLYASSQTAAWKANAEAVERFERMALPADADAHRHK